MSSKPILCIDIDNTIADVNTPLLGILPSLDITKYPAPGITPQTFEDNPWIFTNALPIPKAVKALKFLAMSWEIVYLTARPKWAEKITLEWLNCHGFPQGEVILSLDKGAEVKRLGASLAIDDAPQEIKKLSRIIPVLIYAQPYNQGLKHLGQRITWEERDWMEAVLNFHPVKKTAANGF